MWQSGRCFLGNKQVRVTASACAVTLSTALGMAALLIDPALPAAFDSAVAPPKGDLQVVRVTPEGKEAPPGRQIVVTFDRPIAPIGDMRLDDASSPVSVEPKLKCHWHWLDPRSIACELDERDALLPASEYRIRVKAGVQAEDGSTLKKPHVATFFTQRPAVAQYSFKTWRGPGTPVVRLVFNQPVSRDSVAAHLHFTGQTRVEVSPDPFERDRFYVLPLPGEKETVVLRDSTRPAENGEARRLWLVSPPAELPGGTHAALFVEPGLRGYAGGLLGQEQRTVVEFDTFPGFRFLGVRCRAPERPALIAPGNSGSSSGQTSPTRCNPLSRVSLVFTSPVISQEIRDHLKLTPDLAGGRTDYDPWANVYPYSMLGSAHVAGRDYEVELPEHLQAFKTYTMEGLGNVRDEFGRTISNPIAMRFSTDHRSARLRLSSSVAVLEKDEPTAMPIYVTNLTDVEIRYGRMTSAGTQHDLTANQTVARVWDSAYATPLKVRDLLAGKSGVVSGRLIAHPAPRIPNWNGYFEGDPDFVQVDDTDSRSFFVQVTPFQIHAKVGYYNTLVWVTTLAKGLPVPRARVTMYLDDGALADETRLLGEATTDGAGIASLPGRQEFDPTTRDFGYFGFARHPAKRMMIRVLSGEDLALLPLDWDFSIDTYRASRGTFSSSPAGREGHVKAWGTTAQGVYKLGDTVQYKLYVRNEDNRSLEPVAERAGYRLQIVDPTGKSVHEVSTLALSEFGAYSGEFRVPATAAVGSYEFRLTRESQSWTPMRVLVADFTPAPFQVQNTLNGTSYEPGDEVEVSTRATLHGGGPYAKAVTRVTARTVPEHIDFENPLAADFEFDSDILRGRCDRIYEESESVVNQSEQLVDENGELTTKFTLADANIVYGRIEVESAVRDERGKYVAARTNVGYRGRGLYVGLRARQWTLEEGKPSSVEFLVLDRNGRVVPGVPVSISIAGRVTTAARVKGAGNAYLTSYENAWVPSGSCALLSGASAQTCTFTPSAPGLFSVQASVQDARGRSHTSELCSWAVGKGRVLWDEPEDMSLSIVPEKAAYKVGDRARYLVRNPFPGARALITIERFGVIKSWVQRLEGNTPVIEFPVEPDYLPGFYLSVVAMSPRVASAVAAGSADSGVDLGRPTYRIGYVQVLVTDPYKMLDVGIQSGRATYKPGETVTLQLEAHPHAGKRGAPVEFAVAVVDESVFDLIQDGRSYFDPYRGFFRLDGLDVLNFGLLNRLVGLQKFEKKGANAGGDGGAGFDLRSVKGYLAYWNPAIRADARGHASAQFKLPDNLTGWRVFAIAVTPGDRLGLGDYKFVSTRPTELRPVMPNQLTEGDEFTAGFSVLNRTGQARDLAVDVRATGAIAGGSQSHRQALHLAPFQRETVWIPLRTAGTGPIRLTATAADSSDRDALEYTVPVHARLSLDTAASYGTTLADAATESVLFPKEMIPGTGALSVVVSPTVIGNLGGAIGYLRDYPYGCWEQRLTRALMASDFVRLKDYFPPDFSWPEAPSVPQSVLGVAASFQAPNGGMAFWTAQDDRVSPYLSAATALGFNKLRKAGYSVPADVESRLHDYLQRLLRERAFPAFYSEGMVSSVRAVALEALAEDRLATLADLQRYSEHVQGMDLFGKAAYLQAALQIEGGGSLAASTARQILAHANQSGGKFQFTEIWDDGYWQLLATPGRTQCAILDAFLAYEQTEAGARLVGDVPFKLVRQIVQSRGSRDHWQNTQENLYCLNALVDYGNLYERETPQLAVQATFGGESIGRATFQAFRDPPATLVRPNRAADAGRKSELRIEREGTGRIYYSARLSYALEDERATAMNAGMEVSREYSVMRDGRWQLLGNPAVVARGELVRVDLYLSIGAARNFVAVDDPVPGGLEPVNRDLATASGVDADAGEFQAAGGALWFKYSDWSEYGVSLWNFYHRELRHDSARFYADYLPAGHYHLSYAAQAVAAGEFAASAVISQEMYDPDVYGKGLPGKLIVGHE